MPGIRSSKYSTTQTQSMTMNALGVLLDSQIPLTISEICAADMNLAGQTSQKMSRVLNDLVERGFVKKTKSKSKGKMIYMAVANLEEQGYDLNNFVC